MDGDLMKTHSLVQHTDQSRRVPSLNMGAQLREQPLDGRVPSVVEHLIDTVLTQAAIMRKQSRIEHASSLVHVQHDYHMR